MDALQGARQVLERMGRRGRILCAVAAGAFVLYLLVGFLVVGPVARPFLADALTQALHRQASVGSISVNPLTFRVVVRDLSVAQRAEDSAGGGHFIAFDALDLQLHALSVFKFAPVLSHLRLVKPQVDIAFLGGNRFSFSDLLPQANATTPESPEQPEQPEQVTQDADVPMLPLRIDNLSIVNGTVVLHDMPHKATHVLSELDFSVPLASTLRENAEDFVEPSLRALVNGHEVKLAGRTKPFDKALVTDFTFDVDALDLSRYWEYVPVRTPLTLTSGKLSSEIMLSFSRPENADISMRLSGTVALQDVAMAAPGVSDAAGFSSLRVDVESLDVFGGTLALRDVVLDAPFVHVIRSGQGRINWQGYLPQASSAPGKTPQAEEQASAPFAVTLRHAAVRDGVVTWQDKAVPGGFARQIRPIAMEVTNLSTHSGERGQLDVGIGEAERVTLKGTVGLQPLAAEVDLAVSGISLPAYKAYLEAAQPLKIDSGTAGLALHAMVALDAAQAQPDVRVSGLSAALENLALRKDGNKNPSISLEQLRAEDGSLDLRKRTAALGSLALQAPRARLVRYADGIDLVSLFTASGSPEAGTVATEGDTEPASVKDDAQRMHPGHAGDWLATVAHMTVDAGRVALVDRTLQAPARIAIRDIQLSVNGASTDLAAPVAVEYSASVGGGSRKAQLTPGQVRIQGTVRPSPLDVQVRVRHERVPLAIADSYLGEWTGFLLAGGVLTSDMQNRILLPEGGGLEYASKGTVRIDGLQIKDARDSAAVFGFDSLAVKDYDVSSLESRLHVAEIALGKPQGNARIGEDGVLDIVRMLHGTKPQAAVNGTQPESGAGDAATGESAVESGVESATESGAASAPAADDSAGAQVASVLPYKDVRIDRVRVSDGTFRFSDRSVTPPFATALTGLDVRLDAMSLAPDARPALEVTARLDGQPLSLKGVANPLIKPMYSDLTFSMNGLELVPLTPYALRSVAYPVERGKLYADIRFVTENWVLDAKNKFFVEQLMLGERDKRPDAPSIPIKLGLALLSDSSGNIEIDLPIKGRLDDPKFLTGGIIFKAFVNLIFKVVTSPFALIGNIVGGGGDDAQFSVFEPGSAVLNESQQKSLGTVVEFMHKKPKLKLEIAGFADPDTDPEGLVTVSVRRAVQAAKYQDLSRSERAATSVVDVQVTPDEYAGYLEDAYDAVPEMADDPRPRGLFGFKAQPEAVMEQFLRAQVKVSPEVLDELAANRARAVQEALLALDPSLAPRVSLVGAGRKPVNKPGVALHRAELGVR